MIGIRVVSRSGIPLERLALGVPMQARFGDTVGDIGRGADCTLVLPDPNREISRRQVLITQRGDRHYICPIGTNLVVELNGRALAPDIECPLDVGAAIGIGPYLLKVEELADAPAAGRLPAVEPARANAGPTQDDPMALFGQPMPRGKSVFGDLLDSPTSSGLKPAGTVTGTAPGKRPRGSVDEEADGAPRNRVGRIGRQAAEDLPPTAAKTRRRKPPVVEAIAAPAAPATSEQRPAVTRETAEPLFAALGVVAPVDPVLRAEQMRLAGEMLYAAIEGTLQLLAARTITKREIGDDSTLLQVRENNPLKFAQDADTAMARLLAPPERGFIEPVGAVRGAFSDLRAHQVAILTGMRAALDEVLAKFDPAALEPRLASGAILEKLLPATRKARLWEQYCLQYTEILREVEGDFDTMFSRAFLRAYRAQLAELSRAKKSFSDDER